MLLFVGNVAAAAAGVRTLETQLDYNRAWPGTLQPATPEADLMRRLYDNVATQRPFASIDIHNNTGLSPHYGCLNRLAAADLHLARLFSRTVVYFEKPLGVQSIAMARLCPAVTVECGAVGAHSATAHAVEFVEACLALSHFPEHAPQATDVDLLRTFAVVKVPPEASISVDGSDADIQLRTDIDHLNFSPLAAGTSFGSVNEQNGITLQVEANIDRGADGTVAEYFSHDGGDIRLIEPAIPAMLTRDINAIRLDCLGYLMHRIDMTGRRIED